MAEAHGFRCESCGEINEALNSRGTLRKSCANCRSRNLTAIEYPEHEKLAKVKDTSQQIGFFLELLQMQGVHLMVWEEGNGEEEPQWIDEHDYLEDGTKTRRGIFSGRDTIENPDHIEQGWRSYGKSIQQILADHFHIDLDVLEDEKRAMLEQIRALH